MASGSGGKGSSGGKKSVRPKYQQWNSSMSTPFQNMEKKTVIKKVKKKKAVSRKTNIDDLTLKKQAFLDVYASTFGNITVSAKKIGIARCTVYLWIEQDNQFAEQLKNTKPKEYLKDIAELGLVKRIQEGDTTAIIFALKTQAKDRGYIERTETVNKNVDEFEGKTEEELRAELQLLRDKQQ